MMERGETRSKKVLRTTVFVLSAAVALCVVMYFATRPARGDGRVVHQHPPEHQLLHERFYSKWQRHSNGGSCCNGRDCYPTKAVFDRDLGLWKAQRREDGKMVLITKDIYDPDNPDEVTSPDGQSHLCAPPPLDTFREQYMPQDPMTYYLGKYITVRTKDRVYCFTPGFAN